MGIIASQITNLTIVYSIVYSDTNQRKHQSSASLAFVRGIHRGPQNSPHKWPVRRKCFHLMTSLWGYHHLACDKICLTYDMKPGHTSTEQCKTGHIHSAWPLNVIHIKHHRFLLQGPGLLGTVAITQRIPVISYERHDISIHRLLDFDWLCNSLFLVTPKNSFKGEPTFDRWIALVPGGFPSHKGPVTQKVFSYLDVITRSHQSSEASVPYITTQLPLKCRCHLRIPRFIIEPFLHVW